MLIAVLVIAAVACGLWLTYMVRYPKKWEARIDGLHHNLRSYGLSSDWMREMEKGIALKVLVITLTVLIHWCIAVLLRHPTALTDFLLEHSGRRP
jgi:hypothetical protein